MIWSRILRPRVTTTDVYCVMATVVNERTNVRLSVPLVNALDGFVPDDGTILPLVIEIPTTPQTRSWTYSKFQNFFEVISHDAPAGPRLATDATSSCDDFARFR